MTIAEGLALALQHHQSGRLAEAEEIYRSILAAEPRHADALHLLGLVAHQVGRNDLAIDWIGRAIESAPAPVYFSNLGEAYRAAGQLDQAIAAYRQAIARAPRFPEAFNNLGKVLFGIGQLHEAADAHREAIALRPDFADAHGGLGNALYGLGRLDEAIAAYRQAISLSPSSADAHGNLGNVFYRKGQWGEAIAAYRQAIALAPNVAHYYSNLGTALRAEGRTDGAIDAFRQAIALDPNLAEAFNALGNVLFDAGRFEEAIEAYGRGIAIDANLAEAFNGLGNALYRQERLSEAIDAYGHAVARAQGATHVYLSNLGEACRAAGQLDQAVTACRRALALNPDYPEAHHTLGNALLDGGQLEDAIAACGRAIALNPDFHEAHTVLGVALLGCGKLDDAVAACRRAIALRPDYAEAHSNLGNALKDKGQLDEALACYRQALTLRPDFADAASNLLYSLHFHPGADATSIRREHAQWNRRFGEPLRRFHRPHANDRNPERRLRIGYVSPHFRDHCQSFFTVPLLSQHDHANFEIFCYAHVQRPDALTQRLRGYADVWRNVVGTSDADLAELVRSDGIDVLVDLSMHMAGSRWQVFGRKPAPVQVTWLAYPGSTGLDAVDYRLTDPHLDPPGLFDYAEESVRLPDSFWCYDPLTDSPDVNSLPALASGSVTFGSLNNYCKVNEGVIELWSRVLGAVEGSRLLLLGKPGDHRRRAEESFERCGVAAERIEWFTQAPRPEYLSAYGRIDLGLDTFPYNGHTTSLDSLWMGVPVVTMVGTTAVGRGGLSQAMNLGLPELVTREPDEFVRTAVEFARDLPRLAELRRTLRRRMQESPLMDAPRFARNVEEAYRAMWRTWCGR